MKEKSQNRIQRKILRIDVYVVVLIFNFILTVCNLLLCTNSPDYFLNIPTIIVVWVVQCTHVSVSPYVS
jgi:hypothetical protein